MHRVQSLTVGGLIVGAVLAVSVGAAIHDGFSTTPDEEERMYGLIGKLRTQPGERDTLAAILRRGIAGAPGCLSYVVAEDLEDEDVIWVTEVWESREAHAGSLSLDSVRQAIAEGRELIAGFEQRVETVPVGGVGID